MKVWRPAEDYAIAFGSALGISASKIAPMIGPDVTRNMVIGRRYRIGLGHSKTLRISRSVQSPGKTMPRAGMWTEAEDTILRENRHLAAPQLQKLLPSRTIGAIQGRKFDLRLTEQIRRFTPEEDSILRARYSAHVDVRDIAAELKRSVGVTRQRVLHLGLVRDARKTQLANRFGIDVLKISDDPVVIRQVVLAREHEEKQRAESERAAKVAAALETMRNSIANGGDRALEMRMAMLAGASLQEVGDELGITRERVRQIVHNVDAAHRYQPKPPRTIECVECSAPFEHQGRGVPKWCAQCRPIIAERKRQLARAYQVSYRQTEEGRAIRRNFMRRERLKKKMLELDNGTLAKVLSEVAGIVRRSR